VIFGLREIVYLRFTVFAPKNYRFLNPLENFAYILLLHLHFDYRQSLCYAVLPAVPRFSIFSLLLSSNEK